MASGKNPLMLMMALSVPGAAHAIGLGDIHVDSALNEHFAAEIDIVGATALELTDLRASVANREVFLRYGADRPAFLSSATFKVVQDSRGRPVLAVRSSESFTEPVVNFLVDLNWHNGELVRQYTVLLDPAEYSHSLKTQLAAQAPAAAPVIAAPATVAAAPTALSAATPPETQAQDSVPEAAAQDGRKTTHIKVGAKATLRGIAWRVGERTPSDLQRMMIAIFRANPAAFDGNINRLHRGAVLTIPARAELAAISKVDARREVHAQMQAWRTGTRLAASSPAPHAAASESTPIPATAPVAATAPGAATAGAASAADQSSTEVLNRQVKSLEKELNDLNGVLHSTDAQLQSLQEQAARAEKPAAAEEAAISEKPATAAGPAIAAAPSVAAKLAVAAAPLETVAPAPRAKSDFAALSIVGGLGVLGSALAALYFRMRRRTPPQASGVSVNAGMSGATPLAASMNMDSMAETVPSMAALKTPDSAVTVTYGPVHGHKSADSGDTRPDLQAILEPRRDEMTQPLLPIISTGEPAGRSSIAGGSFSRAAPQEPTVNMRADQGTVRMDPTRLDYNLLDLDMTAQHVHLPSELNEPVRKERRTNLADVLKLAIEREPDRHDLRLKLLELYYSVAATNRQGFLDVVEKFAHERQHLSADQWERIASMGRQIAAGNPMFVDDSLTEGAEDDLADCA
jgi:pilus assembly protein FimV